MGVRRLDMQPAWVVLVGLGVLVGLTSGNGLMFSVQDAYAELKSWGKVFLGRHNLTGTGWARHADIPAARLGISVGHVTLKDSTYHILAHHGMSGVLTNDWTIADWTGSSCDDVGANAHRMTNQELDPLGGYMQIKVCLFTEKGDIVIGSEQVPVDVGYGKIDLTLVDIARCEECARTESVELVLGISMAAGLSSPSASVSPDKQHITSLLIPQAARIYLDDGVLADGRWLELARGYPEVETSSSEIINIIIQIPTYTDSLTYTLLFAPDKERAEVPTTTAPAAALKSPVRYTTLAQDDAGDDYGAGSHYGGGEHYDAGYDDYEADSNDGNKVVHRQDGGQPSDHPTSKSAVIHSVSSLMMVLICICSMLFS